jgi:antitoxin (DNA-binding transcriptional repressor) of toxin-antitoxin stability system
MTTITALELRNNLKNVMERVIAGEEIAVTYRGAGLIKLSAETPLSRDMSGLSALRSAPRLQDPHELFSGAESFKELYHKLIEEKYNNAGTK